MAIEQRGKNWGYRFNVRGREYRQSTDLAAEPRNRKEAEAIEARAKLEAIAGVLQPKTVDGPLTAFAAAADDFLRWCFSTEYRSKWNTARRIQISFQSALVFFGDKTVSEIDADVIEAYKTWRIEQHGVRDVTLRHDLHALSVFFKKYAIRKKLANSNPVDAVSKPSDKDAVRIHIVTREEEGAYFSHARGTLYDVARLMLLQGCRPEEILALEQSAVDLNAEVLHIRGGKSRAAKRDLPLTDESVMILRRRLEKTTGKWVFPSFRIPGGHVTKLNAQHDRCCIDAGVSFVLYDLRHTFATRQLTEAKTDVATLAALMGHSSPIIVLKYYVHPNADAKRSAMKKYADSLKPRLTVVKKETA